MNWACLDPQPLQVVARTTFSGQVTMLQHYSTLQRPQQVEGVKYVRQSAALHRHLHELLWGPASLMLRFLSM